MVIKQHKTGGAGLRTLDSLTAVQSLNGPLGHFLSVFSPFLSMSLLPCDPFWFWAGESQYGGTQVSPPQKGNAEDKRGFSRVCRCVQECACVPGADSSPHSWSRGGNGPLAPSAVCTVLSQYPFQEKKGESASLPVWVCSGVSSRVCEPVDLRGALLTPRESLDLEVPGTEDGSENSPTDGT